MSILSLTDEKHINKHKLFNPKTSINNTQLFNAIPNYDETNYIEHELKEYLYNFPFRVNSSVNNVF